MIKSVPIHLAASLVASVALASDGTDKARLGSVLHAAFQCSTFAELSGDAAEQARLFETGMRVGREFLQALRSDQIPREAVSAEVPVRILFLVGGPSIDFALGRIFESASSDAFDKVAKNADGTAAAAGVAARPAHAGGR